MADNIDIEAGFGVDAAGNPSVTDASADIYLHIQIRFGRSLCPCHLRHLPAHIKREQKLI